MINSPQKRKNAGSGGTLGQAADLLDRAVSRFPAARYFWGVVAASVTVAIVSFLNKLTWVTFISIFAAFLAMLLFYVFSRFERSSDPVVRFVGRLLLVLTGLAFAFVIATAMSLALTCKPPLLAYLYGVSEFCERKSSDTSTVAKPRIAAYRNFIQRDGVWEGVDPVPAEQVKHLNKYYEFTTTSNTSRTLEVRRKNGSAACASDGLTGVTGDTFEGKCSGARACAVRFSYKQDGALDTQEVLDQVGNTLEKIQFPTTEVGQFVDAVFPCDHGRSGIRLIRFGRIGSGTDRGLNETVQFLDKDGHPRPNDANIYGFRSKYQSGRETEQTQLGPRGENWSVGSDVATKRSTYSNAGLLLSIAYFSADGVPATPAGVAREEMKYDTWGNLTETRLLDADGKLTVNLSGIAILKRKYDEHGNLIEAAYFDANGEPTIAKSGEAGFRSTFDDRGNELSRRFFDRDGKTMVVKNAQAGWNAAYDARGLVVEQSFVDLDGRPALLNDGTSVRLTKYDNRLNIIEHRFLGTDRTPAVMVLEGMAISRFTYSDTNKKEFSDGLDSENRPMIGKDGSSSWRAKYDDRGNEIELVHFGLNGEPVITNQGMVGWRNKFDERGNNTGVEYFGIKGEPILNSAGYAASQSKFDEKGNEIEYRYLDVNGKPMGISGSGIAGWRSKFDGRGKEIERTSFGLDGNPRKNLSGVAVTKSKFDVRGNTIETRYFDHEKQPVETDEGLAGWRSTFDSGDNEIERDFFDRDGKGVLIKSGFSGWKAKYDAYGNQVDLMYVGLDGKAVLSSEGIAGSHSTFDSRGNLLERRLLDTEGKLIVAPIGYAIIRTSYDGRRMEILRQFLGIDEKPVLSRLGVAGWRTAYDPRGNVVDTFYFDVKGNAAPRRDGIAAVHYEYDDAGREIVRRLFDAMGKPLRSTESGRSIVRTSYDNRNLKVQESSFDEFDQPVDRPDEHWSTKHWEFDANGQLTAVVLRDKAGTEITSAH